MSDDLARAMLDVVYHNDTGPQYTICSGREADEPTYLVYKVNNQHLVFYVPKYIESEYALPVLADTQYVGAADIQATDPTHTGDESLVMEDVEYFMELILGHIYDRLGGNVP